MGEFEAKEMKVIDLFTKALEHEAVWDLLDHIVVERLKQSRDMLVEERQKIDTIASKTVLQPHQYEDWVTLVQDIQALNHVIDYYQPQYLED